MKPKDDSKKFLKRIEEAHLFLERVGRGDVGLDLAKASVS